MLALDELHTLNSTASPAVLELCHNPLLMKSLTKLFP